MSTKSLDPTPDIPANLKTGWETGRHNFGPRVSFFAPSLKRYATDEFAQTCSCSFMPVSVTGERCALMCDHCRGRILKYMRPSLTPDELFEVAEEYRAHGASGILVSGGSDSDGVVPLLGFVAAMRRLREELGLSVIVHTGLTDRELAQGLAEAGVEAALIDIIGADATIREVCHLHNRSVADYARSLENLGEAGVPASPHVIIGMDRGHIRGELDALELVSRFNLKSLVLVGLLPLAGTPMEGVVPPPPERFGEIFAAARELMPETPILLGCERPAGEHKIQTDALALKAGLNGIAYPAEGTISLAREMGLEPVLSEECCAIVS